jgi:hypothetical protein
MKYRFSVSMLWRLILVCIITCAAIPDNDAKGQQIALFTPNSEISRGPYKTLSLFLVCNPEWVLPESNDKLKQLMTALKHSVTLSVLIILLYSFGCTIFGMIRSTRPSM